MTKPQEWLEEKNLLQAADDAAGALLQVYELAGDRLSPSEQHSVSEARRVCAEFLDGDR